MTTPDALRQALAELVRLDDQYRPDPASHEWAAAWEAARAALSAPAPAPDVEQQAAVERLLSLMSNWAMHLYEPQHFPPGMADISKATVRAAVEALAQQAATWEARARVAEEEWRRRAADAAIAAQPLVLAHDDIARAAQFLEWYADWIKRNVMAANIEEHPYLPELEGVAEALRAPAAPLQPEPSEPNALGDAASGPGDPVAPLPTPPIAAADVRSDSTNTEN